MTPKKPKKNSMKEKLKLCPNCKNVYDESWLAFHDDPQGELCNGCIRQKHAESPDDPRYWERDEHGKPLKNILH